MTQSRRRFVLGVAGGAVIAAADATSLAWAGSEPDRSPGVQRGAVWRGAMPIAGDRGAELRGTDIHLEIGERTVNITGHPRRATVVSGRLPAPTLRWREGETITLRVTNRLTVPSSIHWHGVLVPTGMDGVPGLSFEGIAPGASFVYRFALRQSGTYWYHSHSSFQEQRGLYGPIVIEPRSGDRHRVDRDHVVLLSDWTDLDPAHLYRLLKVDSGYFNFHRRTVWDWLRESRRQGLRAALADRLAWARMRMDPTDLADVSAPAYTYLMNGAPPAGNWTAHFQRGERVRLRLINGSSMSIFDVRIPGLALKVIAADGQDVEPVTVDELRLGGGEVIDVIVEPREERAYAIFAQSIDRSGFALGTLAPRPGLRAEAPAMDPRPLLAMTDMPGMSRMRGMSAGPAETSPMRQMSPMPRQSDAPQKADMPGMAGMPEKADNSGMADMPGMAEMPGMAGYSPPRSADTRAMAGMGDHGAAHRQGLGEAEDRGSDRLDDPGVGLRGNGRRVLTYADLHTLGGPIDARETTRDIVLHLTGNMERFIWSIDGLKYSQAEPLRFKYGERLRLIVVNETMMHHPMHLHGMWGEVLARDGAFQVRKHTITVQPGQRMVYAVSANALGRWAYHCHMLYHMEAGMFREVRVARV